MARTLAPIVVLFAVAGAGAAPREKGPSAEAVAVAGEFARRLGAAVEIVAREYVRPVATTDLYVVAIGGMYDAARRPRPDSLLRELKAAKSEPERLDLVRQARAAVDGAAELADGRDLVVAVSAFTSVLDPHTTLLPNGVASGTVTGEAYGFEFEGEALTVRGGSQPAGGDVRNGDGPVAGRPPLPFRVAVVKPGSPAQKAGVRPGDLVRRIDEFPADVRAADRAFAGLHGSGPDRANPGVHVLEIEREGERFPLQLRLERTHFVPESLFGVVRTSDNTWDYWLDRSRRIAYVRLGPIENDSGERLSEVLHDLGEIRGLVFDLRWCPGGYVDPAVQIASTFLGSGPIAKMKYRNHERGDTGEIRADAGLVRYKADAYPILVLVNGETIGGGELIAAALRDNGRAKVAGTRTFGKASIQWTMSIQGLPGYQFKLTGGMYTRPNGKNLQRFPDSKPTDDWGVRPDPGYELPTSAPLARKLKELHQLYALRPGGSREAMDLDDPAADPQRLRALKLIRVMVEKTNPGAKDE